MPPSKLYGPAAVALRDLRQQAGGAAVTPPAKAPRSSAPELRVPASAAFSEGEPWPQDLPASPAVLTAEKAKDDPSPGITTTRSSEEEPTSTEENSTPVDPVTNTTVVQQVADPTTVDTSRSRRGSALRARLVSGALDAHALVRRLADERKAATSRGDVERAGELREQAWLVADITVHTRPSSYFAGWNQARKDLLLASIDAACVEAATLQEARPAMAEVPGEKAKHVSAEVDKKAKAEMATTSEADESMFTEFVGRELRERLMEEETSAIYLLRHLKRQMSIAKTRKDFDSQSKLRPQLWVITDIVHGAKTKISDEDLEKYLGEIKVPKEVFGDIYDDINTELDSDQFLMYLLQQDNISSWSEELYDITRPCVCCVCKLEKLC